MEKYHHISHKISIISWEKRSIFSKDLKKTPHLLIIISPGQSNQPFWIEFAATGIEFLAIVLGQFSVERVDRDDDRATIGLELQIRDN